MKRLVCTSIFTWITVISACLSMFAQAPADYYNKAVGKKQAALKSAMSQIIEAHTERSYADLWSDFQTTDKRSDGKVWDVYSNSTNYIFVTNQCGNYNSEYDCYNREHSFPKSWFNDGTPMYTDLFHLYPSDGYVNGKRSNYPFGEVSNPTYTSGNGYCKLGNCSFSGYSGIVFEPNNELKGDFARTYFYMVTCYESKISSWSSDQLSANTYPSLSSWSINLFLKWSRQDPVSQKEINRNNAVYSIQKNRNPFIDIPELAEYIWGTKQNDAFAITSGINSVEFKPTIKLINNDLYISDLSDDANLYVMNLQGQIILKQLVFSGINTVQIPQSQPVIIIKLTSSRGSFAKKIYAGE